MTDTCTFCKQPIHGVAVNVGRSAPTYCYRCAQVAVAYHWAREHPPNH